VATCNLVVQRENKRLIFLTCLSSSVHVRISDNGVRGELMALYGNIYKAVEVNFVNKNVTIMIDAIPLLEVAANGSTKELQRHVGSVNVTVWARMSSNHICSGGDDSQLPGACLLWGSSGKDDGSGV
nr:hypothetical protein [Tanacetum cinerariifolium]